MFCYTTLFQHKFFIKLTGTDILPLLCFALPPPSPLTMVGFCQLMNFQFGRQSYIPLVVFIYWALYQMDKSVQFKTLRVKTRIIIITVMFNTNRVGFEIKTGKILGCHTHVLPGISIFRCLIMRISYHERNVRLKNSSSNISVMLAFLAGCRPCLLPKSSKGRLIEIMCHKKWVSI